jgi:hypothetical protein
MIFDILDLGWAHMADTNAAELLQAIATRLPDLAQKAWPDHWQAMQTKEGSQAIAVRFRGLTTQPSDMNWLLGGWSALCTLGPVQAVYTDEWFRSHAAPVISWMRANGLRERRTFGLGCRTRNTSGTELDKVKRSVARLGERAGVDAYLSTYDADRVAKLNTWSEFKGNVDKWPTPSDLPWDTFTPSNLEINSLSASRWPLILGLGAFGVAGYLMFTSKSKKKTKGKK